MLGVRAGVHGLVVFGVDFAVASGVEGRGDEALAGVDGLWAGVESRGGEADSADSSDSVSCLSPEIELRRPNRPSSGMQGGSLSSRDVGISGTGAGGIFGRSRRLPHDEARLCFELLRRFRRNMLIVSCTGVVEGGQGQRA